MGLTYQRGTTVTYYCSFLTLDKKEPTTIIDPKITIRHIDDVGVVITDINEAVMVFAVENTYYYKWTIPGDAFVGNYNCECEATVDSEYTESNETVQVIN